MEENQQKTLVEVVWLDACMEEGHLPLTVAIELRPLERRNAGYLLREDESFIVFAFGIITNFYKGENAYEVIEAIPRAMILDIHRLVKPWPSMKV